MYRTLLGEGGFRKGMDLYFKRHDGQAVSCDDFRAAMADANKVDLDQFERWYLQVGCRNCNRRNPWRYQTRKGNMCNSVCFCRSQGVVPRTTAGGGT